MSKKAIITGATGQTGSFMADYLLENTDLEIFGMVRRLSTPNTDNLKKALRSSRFKIIAGDLSDSQSINSVVEKVKPDYFFNFGAQSFVGSSWELPEQTFDVDAVGVIRALDAIRRFAPECRFYQAGSSEELGKVLYSPQDELHPHSARSPYGAAKMAARQIVKVWRESYGLYAVQGMLFNHEGTRRGEEFVTRKISKGVARILKSSDKSPIQLGNLDAKRDWSDAEDFVDGVWRMMNQEVHRTDWDSALKPADQIKEYILASGKTHSIREFVQEAFYVAGVEGYWVGSALEEKFVWRDGAALRTLVEINPKFYRPCEVELLHGSPSLAAKDLGWIPKSSFKELVAKMVKNDLAAFSRRSDD